MSIAVKRHTLASGIQELKSMTAALNRFTKTTMPSDLDKILKTQFFDRITKFETAIRKIKESHEESPVLKEAEKALTETMDAYVVAAGFLTEETPTSTTPATPEKPVSSVPATAKKRCLSGKAIGVLTLGAGAAVTTLAIKFKNSLPTAIAKYVPSQETVVETVAKYVPSQETVVETVAKYVPDQQTIAGAQNTLTGLKDSAMSGLSGLGTQASNVPGAIKGSIANAFSGIGSKYGTELIKLFNASTSLLPSKDTLASAFPGIVDAWNASGKEIMPGVSYFTAVVGLATAITIITAREILKSTPPKNAVPATPTPTTPDTTKPEPTKTTT